MKKNRIIAISVATLAGVGLLAGCTSDNSKGGNPTAPAVTVGSTPMSAPTPSLAQRNYTFQDSGLGHSIKVIEFLNDLPLSDADSATYAGSVQGGSVVALHLSATAGTVLPTYVYDSNFTVQCAGMSAPAAPVRYFADDLTAAGYTAWTNPNKATNMDGWLTYTIAGIKNPTGCYLIYNRAEVNGLDGKPIAAFTKTVQLN